MTEPREPYSAGWASDLPTFQGAAPRVVCLRLQDFVRDAGPEQVDAWARWIPALQTEAEALLAASDPAREYTAILEYQLPRDLRRPDVIVLEQGVVVVLELKGRPDATRAGLDQVLAYARDLRTYHAACHARPVVPVLVISGGANQARVVDGAWVVGPRGVHASREGAATRTRHLVVLTGVPGSGKTLVGLQLAHAHWLDELAVARAGGKPATPAVFLSGNGPLVTVLQDALKCAGGGGKTFVQGIKQYVAHYSGRRQRVPPEHLIVFDEAQRAHDAERVAKVHGHAVATVSEPQLLLDFLQRVPDWCVLVALVGSGQAIHQGEEGGLPLWRAALEAASGDSWTVHAAATAEAAFTGASFMTRWHPALNLDVEIRHHLVPRVHAFVAALLDAGDATRARPLADELFAGGFRLLWTHDLDAARAYLRERYGEAPLARYGLVASSKDKVLPEHGVDNEYQTVLRVRVGPWFNAAPRDRQSCCQLSSVCTEFQVQGLELDMALLAWGSDLLWDGDRWSIAGSRGTRGRIHDQAALRRNVYRVLLTRGRDGTVVFVPPRPEFEATGAFLRASGFREL